MSESKKSIVPALLLGGGTAALAGLGAWWVLRRINAATAAVEKAVATGGIVKAHATGYWPFVEGLTAKERLMEGGVKGAASWNGRRVVDPRTGKRVQLHTLEQHLSDPVKYPEVSVSGDPVVWPFGQRLVMSPWPNAVFRVVDTGGHFTGIHKTFRVFGEEPLDIAVNSSKTFVPKKDVTARIVAGDNWQGGQAVAVSKLKDQTVAGDFIVEGRTSEDREALARMVESELGGRSREEQVAAAWAARNRADLLGVTVQELLAPTGEYGSSSKSGGYASTRRVPTDRARRVAAEVLDAAAESDPTTGAIDYWVPSQQVEMCRLGDVYRAALRSGDDAKANRYARWAQYGSEDEVRDQHRRSGILPTTVVGSVELLKRAG